MVQQADASDSISWAPLSNFQLAASKSSSSSSKDACGVELSYGKFLVVGGQQQPQEDNDKGNANSSSTSKSQLVEWNMRRSFPWPALQEPRFGAVAVNYNNESVWVVGGSNEDGCVLNTVEGFALSRTQNPNWNWSQMANLPTPRIYAAAVAIPTEQCILVLGGRDGSWQELSTMEVGVLQDTEDDHDDTSSSSTIPPTIASWTTLSDKSMPGPRMGCAAVVTNETSLLLLGGYDGRSWLRSCHSYEFQLGQVAHGTWTELPDMMETVRFVKAVRYYKYILVVGEKTTENNETSMTSSCIQCYDTQHKEWIWSKTCVGPSMDVVTLHGTRLYGFSSSPDNDNDNDNKSSSSPIFSCELHQLDPKMVAEVIPVAVGATAATEADIADTPTILATEAVLVAEDMGTNTNPRGKGGAVAQPYTPEAPVKLRNVVKIKLTERSYYTGQLRKKDGTYVPHGQGLLVWVEEDKDNMDASMHSASQPPPSSYYKGQFLNGFRHGLGEMYLRVEDKHYFGAFEYGSWEGMGSLKIRSRGYSFFGQFQGGEMTGYGRCSYRVKMGDQWKQKTYSGGFHAGLAHGKGVIADYLTGRIETDTEFHEEDLFGIGSAGSMSAAAMPGPNNNNNNNNNSYSNHARAPSVDA